MRGFVFVLLQGVQVSDVVLVAQFVQLQVVSELRVILKNLDTLFFIEA